MCVRCFIIIGSEVKSWKQENQTNVTSVLCIWQTFNNIDQRKIFGTTGLAVYLRYFFFLFYFFDLFILIIIFTLRLFY